MKTAICTQIKNETRYLKEWVDYHIGLGIDHIFLFEDYGSDSHIHIVGNNNHVTLSTVERFGIHNYHNTKTQHKVCCKLLDECKMRGDYDWILFIDADEFITFEDGYDLQRVCNEYANAPAILMSWMNYGANGHIKRPQGKLLDNYTKPGVVIERDRRWAKKSMVNVRLCKGLYNIHIAAGAKDVIGNGESAPLVYKKIWIRHFFTKSWEDFCERIFERGNMNNNFRTLDNFFVCNPDMRHLKKELIESVRYRHAMSTMWLSKDLKIISGGNINHIKELENGHHKK